ncbi:hypothetical protein DERF_012408 [Dermatophagoides farinae]|uniref:Retroviral polymerase SH3-like domain-containing protein n=1 Tax=Dermatophagoides farinae TaxID=6954 RepID=A0A922HPI4_DERFA|nr:hypothetical protein DERF_012408 [Dermatophagoides farinae]
MLQSVALSSWQKYCESNRQQSNNLRHTFGCVAYHLQPKQKQTWKLDPTATKLVFIRYTNSKVNFRLLDPSVDII